MKVSNVRFGYGEKLVLLRILALVSLEGRYLLGFSDGVVALARLDL